MTTTFDHQGRPLDRPPLLVREYVAMTENDVLDKADKDALQMEAAGYIVGMASWTRPENKHDPLRLTVTYRYDEIAAYGGGGGSGIWRRLKGLGGDGGSGKGKGKGRGGGIGVSASKSGDAGSGSGPSSPLILYAFRCGGLFLFMGFMFFFFGILLGQSLGLELNLPFEFDAPF